MEELFIKPMQLMNPLGGLPGVGLTERSVENGNLFKDFFQNAVSDVVETDNNLAEKQYLLSTGQIDDAHTVPLAASQAQLSVDLLVQLRNKAMESYNQLMNISL